MKLPIKVKQNVRDEFESRLPVLQARMARLGLAGYTFEADPELLFSYAKDGTPSYTDFGKCIYTYFDSFVSCIEQHTEPAEKTGQEVDVLKSLQKVAPNYVVTPLPLLPEESNKFTYANISIDGGQVWIYVNADKFGQNPSKAASNLIEAIDEAFDAQHAHLPPASIERGVKSLAPNVPQLETEISKILGQPYKFEANISENYQFLQKESKNLSDSSYLSRLPEFVHYYFDSAVRALSSKNFEESEVMRSMFNEAVNERIIRFEVVDSLKDQQAYCDCEFVSGEWKLQTTPSRFGLNVRGVAENVVSRLEGRRPSS